MKEAIITIYEMIGDFIKEEREIRELRRCGFKNKEEMKAKYSLLLKGKRFEKAKSLRNKFKGKFDTYY